MSRPPAAEAARARPRATKRRVKGGWSSRRPVRPARARLARRPQPAKTLLATASASRRRSVPSANPTVWSPAGAAWSACRSATARARGSRIAILGPTAASPASMTASVRTSGPTAPVAWANVSSASAPRTAGIRACSATIVAFFVCRAAARTETARRRLLRRSAIPRPACASLAWGTTTARRRRHAARRLREPARNAWTTATANRALSAWPASASIQSRRQTRG